MIPQEELHINSYVILVSSNKNFLAKIISEGKPHQSRLGFSRFNIEYNNPKLTVASPYNDMFKGVELNVKAKEYLLGFSPDGFIINNMGVLSFRGKSYSAEPIYLHQFQTAYLEIYGNELPISEDLLEKYVTTLPYEKIINENRSISEISSEEGIRITVSNGSKESEIFKIMKAQKDAFREAVVSGKLNEYAKEHPNTLNANTALPNNY